MSSYDFRREIEGYDNFKKEAEICRKYGIDYTTQRGMKEQLLERLHPKRLHLRVSEIIQETETAATLRLVSQNQYLPPFQAGQYINIFVEINGVKTSRPYSISSSPSQTAYYDITVRRVPNGFVSDYLLNHIQIGDLLESTGPSGQFVYNAITHGNKEVFLAGGSGITPFMSMIREVTDRGLNRQIHLIYGCQLEKEVLFHEELQARATLHENFRYSLVISNPSPGYSGLSGYIDRKLISQEVLDIDSSCFNICGPAAMYEFCIPELEKLGVPHRRLRKEIFSYPNICSNPGWPSEVKADSEFELKVGDRIVKAKANESLMVTMERNGISVNACCRSGECSLCRVKLIAGKVFQPAGILLRKTDRQFGYIHSCQSYPLENVEISL